MEEFNNRITTKTKAYQHSYKFSAMLIGENKTKKEQVELLKKPSKYRDIKINKKLSVNDLKKYFIENITTVGILNDKSNRTDASVKETNFIFVDIDKTFTIEQAMEILDKDKLSYVIFTSSSHTEEKHKFHILIATLKKITKKEDYKAYYSHINELFDNENDSSCSSWSKACFASPTDCIVINKLFRNDLILDAKQINTYKKIYSETISDKTKLSENDCEFVNPNYLKQITSSNPNYILAGQTDKVIKFKRDENDFIGNVFNKHNEEKHLVDGKRITDLLFSNDNYNVAKKSEEIRLAIQKKIKKEIEYSLLEISMINELKISIKKIIIANEGVGKSQAVIEACKNYKLIFATFTKSRLDEISKSLKKENIKYSIVLSIEDILKKYSIEQTIIEEYLNSFKNEYNDTSYQEAEKVDSILSRNNIEQGVINKIHSEIIKQDKLLESKDRIVLVTIQKLKFFLKTSFDKKILPIILDEINIADFHSYSSNQSSKNQKASSHRDFYKNDIHLYKNIYNMFELLKNKSVILLTTEKSLIEPLFKNKDDYEIFDCTEKLEAENVKYYITNTSSSKKVNKDESKRDLLINELKKKNNDIDLVISDNSKFSDISNLGIRGSNEYSDKTILVVGTYPSSEEEYLYYLSCKEYFDEKFKKDKLIQAEIQKLFIESRISQSIGRNSGFRYRGKKCYVALPLLSSNSCRRLKIKDFKINYISSNVEYLKIQF